MNNNIDMLISMFEELKNSQQAIAADIKKLEKLRIPNNNVKSELPPTDEITTYIKNILSEGMLVTLSSFYESDIETINKNIRKTNEQFENFLLSNSPKLKHQHTHFIDFKSSKFLLGFIGAGIACLISIGINITLYNTSLEYEEADWKYRFVKASKGVTGNELQDIEKAFDPVNPNEKAIEILKTFVLKREKEILDKAKNLEYHELIEK